MLAAIGVESVAELFEQVPEPLRLDEPLALPAGMSEAEVHERLSELAARNADCERQVCFLGAGMYDHYVPAIVDAITQRSEFLTPYTPYQPEISQGGLQAMFEFQTMMSELTGLPVSTRGRPPSPRPPTWRSARPRDGGASSSRAASTRTAARRWRPTARASTRRSRRSGWRMASPTRQRSPRRSTVRRPRSSCRARTSSVRSRTSRRSAPPPGSAARCSSSPQIR
jgi:Glycine cleavage system P-protein